jgi:hypothetical protein
VQDDRDRATPDDEQSETARRLDDIAKPPASDETAAEFETAPVSAHGTSEPEPIAPGEVDAAQAADAKSESAPESAPSTAAEAVPPSEAGLTPEAMTYGEPAPDAGAPPQEAEAYPTPISAPEQTPPAAAHTVPPTDVGESTLCPRCGTENRPGVAFCRNCGQRLVAAGVATTVERPSAPEGTQQCPRCGTVNRAGVAFCQNCGANLRAAGTPAPGYVPPSAEQVSRAEAAMPVSSAPARGGAILGPLVLLVGAIGLAAAWFLPFPYGAGSLWDRSFGTSAGYGVAFWNGYSSVTGGILDSAYFGFAAAAPLLLAILLLLILAGFLRAAPGGLQLLGLLVALLWALGLAATFVALEGVGNWNGDLVGMLRNISPSGIIFLLSSLIVLIGTVTRFARS